MQLARLVADEVAEQADGALLGLGAAVAPAAAPRAARAQDVRAALRVELGDDPGVREADERDRQRERLQPHEQRRRADERDDVRDRRQRPQPAVAAQLRGIDARAPVDRRGLRQDLDGRHRAGSRARSAAGDRQAHDHELGVDRQLADVLGVARARC